MTASPKFTHPGKIFLFITPTTAHITLTAGTFLYVQFKHDVWYLITMPIGLPIPKLERTNYKIKVLLDSNKYASLI